MRRSWGSLCVVLYLIVADLKNSSGLTNYKDQNTFTFTAGVVGAPQMTSQAALWDLPISRPVHSLMLSPHLLFFCLVFFLLSLYLHHHHHQFLNREGCWGTTDDFTTSYLHFSLVSTALYDFANSRPVRSLMLSFHFLFSLPCLLPPFTVPCKMVLARPDVWETCPCYFTLRLFTMVRSPCGPIACWISAQTSSLVKWSVYEIRIISRWI